MGTPRPMKAGDAGFGKRTTFQEALEKATNMTELATSFRGTFVRYHTGFAELFTRDRRKQPKIKPFVTWLAGPTGCGKTRTAYETAVAAGTVWMDTGSKLNWFDGYDG